MKKSEMKKEAKRVILKKFKEVIRQLNRPYSSVYLDVLWEQCYELEGILWAYRCVGLISDKQYNALISIKSNIDCFQDIFDRRYI